MPEPQAAVCIDAAAWLQPCLALLSTSGTPSWSVCAAIRHACKQRSRAIAERRCAPCLRHVETARSVAASLRLSPVRSPLAPVLVCDVHTWHCAGRRAGGETNATETSAGASVQAFRLPGVHGMRGLRSMKGGCVACC